MAFFWRGAVGDHQFFQPFNQNADFLNNFLELLQYLAFCTKLEAEKEEEHSIVSALRFDMQVDDLYIYVSSMWTAIGSSSISIAHCLKRSKLLLDIRENHMDHAFVLKSPCGYWLPELNANINPTFFSFIVKYVDTLFLD